MVISTGMDPASPHRVQEITNLLGPGVPLQRKSHLEFKRLVKTGNATVRTGDKVP